MILYSRCIRHLVNIGRLVAKCNVRLHKQNHLVLFSLVVRWYKKPLCWLCIFHESIIYFTACSVWNMTWTTWPSTRMPTAAFAPPPQGHPPLLTPPPPPPSLPLPAPPSKWAAMWRWGTGVRMLSEASLRGFWDVFVQCGPSSERPPQQNWRTKVLEVLPFL